MRKPWLILFVVLLLQACGLTQRNSTYRIAFSQCVGSDAWRQTMLEEMKRELSFHDGVDFVYRDAANSSAKQIQQLRELAALAPDLIIISPNEAEPLTPIVDSIYHSGIPIVVTDRKTSSGLYQAYVGADNYEIGYMAGNYLAEKLRGVGKIAEITGLPKSSANVERQKGFHDALANYPAIHTHIQINGQWLIDTAREAAIKHIRDVASSDAIFAYNDQMALGAFQAIQSPTFRNQKTKIVGVDALPGDGNGMQFVANETFVASMLYPTGGKECIQTALAILRGKPYQRENILGTLVVDSNNVEMMQLQSDKIISQQRDIDRQQALYAEQQRIFSNQQRMLNILVISLVLAVVFAGISFYSLKANWEKNKQLEKQNHEILGQQQQIISMSRKIEQATEAKINFFTNISHELKTPLTLMLLPLENLQKRAKITHEEQHALDLVKKNALTLRHLVSQLLDLRRVGYEKLKINPQLHNALIFCHSIVQLFRPVARQKHINLRLENNTVDPRVWFDADQMEKVVANLLSNAFKFTSANGEIIVRLVIDDTRKMFGITVEDNGMGIGKKDLDHIFEPFFQGDNHGNGTGIGLVLSKEIVALHHGEIKITSTENEGTTVTVWLPSGDAHFEHEAIDEATARAEANMAINSEYVTDVVSYVMRDSDSTESITEKPWDAERRYTVLVVEDNPDMRHFLAEQLESEYHVYVASTGQAGFDNACHHVPDLVISDVMMPNGSGMEMVKKLKADTRTAHIPVILLTARDSGDQKLLGLAALADAYVTKPFDLRYLFALVHNLITNRLALQNLFSSESAELRPSIDICQADKRFLNDLSAFVDDHLCDTSLGVDTICECLSVSKMQLYRKMKILLNCSIHDYIITKRLNKSKVLLLQDIPVNLVAYQAGFSTPAYFSTAFKNKYGVTPSAFKKDKRVSSSV